ncbi:MAG TPA: multiheme c-type cytochrome, partial [Pirellulales bacterium]|nr:multiheme c-type cytochrome [Pirellulales bacterium]
PLPQPPIALVLIFALLAASATRLASAQEADTEPHAAFIGVVECARCHRSPTPLDRESGATDWASLTEFETWYTDDKHSQAFKLLDSERGRQMSKILGIDVLHNAQCLSCHCNLLPHSPPLSELEQKQGVSCESCHGPGSQYEKPHRDPGWRMLAGSDKEKLGMVDVRDPRQRARQCLGCHVGNVAEGKVLTHAMYAAGHPPLPGFEIETFAREMPPHWRTLADKPAAARDDPRIREALHEKPDEVHAARSVVVGGVMSLAESVRLLSEQAAAAEPGEWPDFAMFDCQMCHHELATPSWRQQRLASDAGRARPGQPRMRAWPSVLVELGIDHLHRDDADARRQAHEELKTRLATFQKTFDGVAWGARRGKDEGLSAAAQSLLDWLDALAGKLDAADYDPSAARMLLADLCALGEQPSLDYDSARELAWALEAIGSAVVPAEPADADDWQRILAALDHDLLLDLPATQQRSILDPRRQQAVYEAVGNYDPAQVRRRFGDLSKLLAPE